MKEILIYVRDTDNPYVLSEALGERVIDLVSQRQDVSLYRDDGGRLIIPYHAINSIEINEVGEK